jgi:hypothetical protein
VGDEKRIYAYLCIHQVRQIKHADNTWMQPTAEGGPVFLTDLEVFIPKVLVPAHHSHCTENAMRWRLADPSRAIHWSKTKDLLTEDYRWQLELLPEVMPMHWYVAFEPVQLLPDEAMKR